MPIYEYQCSKCGTFEVSQRITETPLRRCTTCRGRVRKLISQTSFQLKGSGWYVTDYASKGNAKEEGKTAESGKTSEAGKGSEGTTASEPSAAKTSEPSKSPSKDGSSKAAASAA